MIDVRAYDGPSAPEPLVRAVYALWQAEADELRPDEPSFSWEEVLGGHRIDNDRELRRRWVAVDGEDVIGRAEVRMPVLSNQELAIVDLYVAASARRRGAGTAMLTAVLDETEPMGRRRLRTQIVEGSPGEAWLRDRGGAIALTNRMSRMDLTALDRRMVRQWVERAEREAPGYSLRWIEVGPSSPRADLQGYVDVRSLMNTVPHGDLTDEPWQHTVESVLTEAAEQVAQHWHRWVAVTVEEATGAFVGFTEVVLAESTPDHAWQGGTAVHPDHRRRGLGRWLKGAMAERLLAEHPEIRYVNTENAYVNEPMLAINTAMGFEIVHTMSDWQADVAAVRAALTRHPLEAAR